MSERVCAIEGCGTVLVWSEPVCWEHKLRWTPPGRPVRMLYETLTKDDREAYRSGAWLG